MNTTDTSYNNNNPVSPNDAPVLLSGGILADARNCGPIEIHVSGGTFAVDKDNARIRIRLTVDDGGSIVLRHQETGQEFGCSASLPEGGRDFTYGFKREPIIYK